MLQSVMTKDGISLSYAEYGDKNGYPILIQHGLIASITDGSIFEQLIELGAHLICIARPGYGQSSPYEMKNFAEWADVVSTIIDKLVLTQFDILGISSGAPYSYAIGYKFPDKVRNLYIFSGIPALYNAAVLSVWPYPVQKNASIAEMQNLAYEIFFSTLSEEDLANIDIKDSIMNQGFGVAQDLRLRFMDWGFNLSDVKENVYMRHSKFDENVPFSAAEMTSKLLPNCSFEAKEDNVHFSKEALDDFIKNSIAAHFGEVK